MIVVKELRSERDNESLTGASAVVTPEWVREKFDATSAMNICLAGEVRLTAQRIATLGLDGDWLPESEWEQPWKYDKTRPNWRPWET